VNATQSGALFRATARGMIGRMKKVVVFSDSGIFIQTVSDTPAEKSEE
jgi:hypothetical protein